MSATCLSRSARWIGALAAVALATAVFPSAARGQLLQVVRIEEDWELKVAKPNALNTAPQIVCAFSPTGDAKSLHATFELNHQNQPSFLAGGLQLQTWEGAAPLVSKKASSASLSTENEIVTWTQAMTVADGQVAFEIVNGQSTTWGSFGGEDLTATAFSSLPDLNAYNPLVSVEHSGVSYAANRVESLKLVRVRVVLSTGEILEDSTVHVVHPPAL